MSACIFFSLMCLSSRVSSHPQPSASVFELPQNTTWRYLSRLQSRSCAYMLFICSVLFSSMSTAICVRQSFWFSNALDPGKSCWRSRNCSLCSCPLGIIHILKSTTTSELPKHLHAHVTLFRQSSTFLYV